MPERVDAHVGLESHAVVHQRGNLHVSDWSPSLEYLHLQRLPRRHVEQIAEHSREHETVIWQFHDASRAIDDAIQPWSRPAFPQSRASATAIRGAAGPALCAAARRP